MKKIGSLLALIMLITSHSLSAQTKEEYLLKSKHQKTAALILFSGGITLVVIGVSMALRDFDKGLGNIFNPHPQPVSNGNVAEVLAITGAASVIGSIPLFIASSKNKHIAMILTFTNQPIPALVKNVTGNKSFPSISLQFKL